MKFKTYLNEESSEEIKSLIEKDCQPFLKNWDNLGIGLLYTGRKVYISAISKSQVRKDRKPKDMPEETHKIIDNWFYKKFGVRSRSNAVFATFNEYNTYQYGDLFMIFPIDNYIVISSDKVKDLWLYFKRKENWILNPDDFNDKKKYKEDMWSILNDLEYKKGFPRHRNELMITCKEYYLVNYEYEPELLKGLS
jgi:hypothetical protein